MLFLEILKHVSNQNYIFELINFLLFFVGENFFLKVHLEVFLKIIEFIFIKLVSTRNKSENLAVISKLIELIEVIISKLQQKLYKFSQKEIENILTFSYKVLCVLIENFIDFKNKIVDSKIEKSDKIVYNEEIKITAGSLRIISKITQIYFEKNINAFPLNFKRICLDLIVIYKINDWILNTCLIELISELSNQNIHKLEIESMDIKDLKMLTDFLINEKIEFAISLISKSLAINFENSLMISDKLNCINNANLTNLNKALFKNSKQKIQKKKGENFQNKQKKLLVSRRFKFFGIIFKSLMTISSDYFGLNSRFLFKILKEESLNFAELKEISFKILISIKSEVRINVLEELSNFFGNSKVLMNLKMQFIKSGKLLKYINQAVNNTQSFFEGFRLYFSIMKYIYQNYYQFLKNKKQKLYKKINHDFFEISNNKEFLNPVNKRCSDDFRNKNKRNIEYKLNNGLKFEFVSFQNLEKHFIGEFFSKQIIKNKKTIGLCFLRICELQTFRAQVLDIPHYISIKIMECVFEIIGENPKLDIYLLRAIIQNPWLLENNLSLKITEKLINYVFNFDKNEPDFEKIKFRNENIKINTEIHNLIFEVQILLLLDLIEKKSNFIFNKTVLGFIGELTDLFFNFLSNRCNVIFSKQISETEMIFNKNELLEVVFENYKTANELNQKNLFGILKRRI